MRCSLSDDRRAGGRVSWPQWLALARACEQHGIPALFRSDHYMNLDGQHPERGALDAWGTLCGLAAVTSTLAPRDDGLAGHVPPPLDLAKLVATADHVSGGRVELGLGAGWHEREHAAYGFPFADTRTRMDVLEEQLQIVLGQRGATDAFSIRRRALRARRPGRPAQAGPAPAPAADHGRQRRSAQRQAGRRLRRRVQHAVPDPRRRPRAAGRGSTRPASRPGAIRSRSRS